MTQHQTFSTSFALACALGLLSVVSPTHAQEQSTASFDDTIEPDFVDADFSADGPDADAVFAAAAAGGIDIIEPREGSPIGPFSLGRLDGTYSTYTTLSADSPTLLKATLAKNVTACDLYPAVPDLNPKVTIGKGYAAVLLTPPATLPPAPFYTIRLLCFDVDGAVHYYVNDAVRVLLQPSLTSLSNVRYEPAGDLLVLDRSYTFRADVTTTSPSLDCWANYWINDESYESPVNYDARRAQLSFTVDHWAGGRKVAFTCRDRRDLVTASLDLPQTARVLNGDTTPPTITEIGVTLGEAPTPSTVAFSFGDNKGVLGCSVNVTARGSNKTFIYTLRENAVRSGSVVLPVFPMTSLDFLNGNSGIVDITAHCFDAAFNISPIVAKSLTLR
jgi:hypothetical protein